MGIFYNEPNFNKYRFFYAVAECESFSKATQILHVSQPAISYAIKELEGQLGVKLFIRDKKKVILTDDGEKLLYYVKSAFDNLTMGERIIKEKDNDLTGVIRIGIYSHISLFMLPLIMKRFNEKYPNAKFYIYATSNMEMIEKLRNRELDFIVLQYPIFINETNLTEEVVCELETCFFCDKKHFDLYSRDNNSFKDFSLILPMRGYSDINRLEETLKKHNLHLKNNITSYTTELTIELAKQGVGVGWGLKKCVEDYIKKGQLYELPINFNTPITKFSVAYDEFFLNHTTREFLKFFKEELKKIK